MREKFRNPTLPDYHEQQFIRVIEQYKRIKKETLHGLIFGFECKSDKYRDIRKFQERYNNSKYTDIIPLGKIININGIYTLVRSDNPLANKVRNKAKFDLICAAIDYQNTLKALGHEVHDNQISLYDIAKMSLNEHITRSKELDQE